MSTQSAARRRLGRAESLDPVAAFDRGRVLDWESARIVATIGLLTGLLGLLTTVGADARWLAALGHVIAGRHAIPPGVPFAAAPSGHWANPLALAELIFNALEGALGDRGLTLAQLTCVAVALSVIGADARAARVAAGGAAGWAIPAVLAAVVCGSVASLAIARVQMFSLVLFPALAALLHAETRRPSWRVWLSLPLLALWSNLHGAVLGGLLVLLAYLAVERFRRDRMTAVGVAILAPVALCLTPAGLRTLAYLHGLLTNVAAQRGAGLWAPLGDSPLDWVSVVAAAGLGLAALRRPRPRVWEALAIAAFAVLTVRAARNGVWLLFLLAAPAVSGASSAAAHAGRARRSWNGLVPISALLALVLLVAAVTRVPPRAGVSRAIVAAALRLAAGRPILADAMPAEQIALAGGRIWAGNPLDAFSRATQSAYLDFIGSGRGPRVHALLADRRIAVILATAGSPAARAAAGDDAFAESAHDATAVVYLRRPQR
jgi:hypothetical protein